MKRLFAKMKAGLHVSLHLWDTAQLSEENHNDNSYAIGSEMSLDTILGREAGQYSAGME